jgi:hypothetical protein
MKLTRFYNPKATCFLSYVEYKTNINTSNIIFTKKYRENIYSKVGLVVETKGGGKEGKEDNK